MNDGKIIQTYEIKNKFDLMQRLEELLSDWITDMFGKGLVFGSHHITYKAQSLFNKLKNSSNNPELKKEEFPKNDNWFKSLQERCDIHFDDEKNTWFQKNKYKTNTKNIPFFEDGISIINLPVDNIVNDSMNNEIQMSINVSNDKEENKGRNVDSLSNIIDDKSQLFLNKEENAGIEENSVDKEILASIDEEENGEDIGDNSAHNIANQQGKVNRQMDNKCCIASCDLSKNTKNLKLYKFPRGGNSLSLWLLATKTIAGDASKKRICEKHFENKLLGKTRLKSGAIPTLFLENSFVCSEIKHKSDLMLRFEELLSDWITDMFYKGLVIRSHHIKYKAQSLYNELKQSSKNPEIREQEFPNNDNWLRSLQKRCDIYFDNEKYMWVQKNKYKTNIGNLPFFEDGISIINLPVDDILNDSINSGSEISVNLSNGKEETKEKDVNSLSNMIDNKSQLFLNKNKMKEENAGIEGNSMDDENLVYIDEEENRENMGDNSVNEDQTLNMSQQTKKLKIMNEINITMKEKLYFIQLLDEGVNVKDIANKFDVTEKTIKLIHKNAENVRSNFEAQKIIAEEDKKIQTMEELLTAWVSDMNNKNLPINTNIIKEKAKSIYNDLEGNLNSADNKIKFFKASDKWFEKWFEKHPELHDTKLLDDITDIHLIPSSEIKLSTEIIIIKDDLTLNEKEIPISDDNNILETDPFDCIEDQIPTFINIEDNKEEKNEKTEEEKEEKLLLSLEIESPEFSEALIKEIKKRKLLYDKKYKNDFNTPEYALKEEAWKKISEKLKKSVNECKTHWKYLREQYLRLTKANNWANDIQEMEYFEYYKSLTFLRKHIELTKKIDLVDYETVHYKASAQHSIPFTKALIKEVKAHEILYNTKNKFNFSKNQFSLEDKAWKEIAEKLNESVFECKNLWNILRQKYICIENANNYANDIQRIKNFEHYNSLTFLKDHIEQRDETEESLIDTVPIKTVNDDVKEENQSIEKIISDSENNDSLKTKLTTVDLENQSKIIQLLYSGIEISEVAKIFGLPECVIQEILYQNVDNSQQEQQSTTRTTRSQTKKSLSNSFDLMNKMEEELLTWILQMSKRKKFINIPIIQKEARNLLMKLKKNTKNPKNLPKLNSEWFKDFRKRSNLKCDNKTNMWTLMSNKSSLEQAKRMSTRRKSNNTKCINQTQKSDDELDVELIDSETNRWIVVSKTKNKPLSEKDKSNSMDNIFARELYIKNKNEEENSVDKIQPEINTSICTTSHSVINCKADLIQEMEKILSDWVLIRFNKKQLINLNHMRHKAKCLFNELKENANNPKISEQEFSCTNSWLNAFIKRCVVRFNNETEVFIQNNKTMSKKEDISLFEEDITIINNPEKGDTVDDIMEEDQNSIHDENNEKEENLDNEINFKNKKSVIFNNQKSNVIPQLKTKSDLIRRMEELLKDWIHNRLSKTSAINQSQIRTRAKIIFNKLKENSNNPEIKKQVFSKNFCWLRSFQKRYNINLNKSKNKKKISNKKNLKDMVEKSVDDLSQMFVTSKDFSIQENSNISKDFKLPLTFNAVCYKNDKKNKSKIFFSNKLTDQSNFKQKMEELLTEWIIEMNNRKLSTNELAIKTKARRLFYNLRLNNSKFYWKQKFIANNIWFKDYVKHYNLHFDKQTTNWIHSYKVINVRKDIVNNNINYQSQMSLNIEEIEGKENPKTSADKMDVQEEVVIINQEKINSNFEHNDSSIKKKTIVDLENQLKIVQLLDNGTKISEVSKTFCLPECVIKKILNQNATNLRNYLATRSNKKINDNLSILSDLITKMEEQLVTWILEISKTKVFINTSAIQTKALCLFMKLAKNSTNSKDLKQTFSANFEWFRDFRKRSGLHLDKETNCWIKTSNTREEPLPVKEYISLIEGDQEDTVNNSLNHQILQMSNTNKKPLIDEGIVEVIDIINVGENNQNVYKTNKKKGKDKVQNSEDEMNVEKQAVIVNQEKINSDFEQNDPLITKTTIVDLENQLNIIQLLDNGTKISEVSKIFDLPENVIKKILKKNSNSLRNYLTKTSNKKMNDNLSINSNLIKKMEEKLLTWILGVSSAKGFISTSAIQTKARKLLEKLEENSTNSEDLKHKFCANFEWFRDFRNRVGLHLDKKTSCWVITPNTQKEPLPVKEFISLTENNEKDTANGTLNHEILQTSNTNNEPLPKKDNVLLNEDEDVVDVINIIKDNMDDQVFVDKENKKTANDKAENSGGKMNPKTKSRTVNERKRNQTYEIKTESELMLRLEELLSDWITEMFGKGLVVGSLHITYKAKSLFNELKQNSKNPELRKEEFPKNDNWFKSLQKRCDIHFDDDQNTWFQQNKYKTNIENIGFFKDNIPIINLPEENIENLKDVSKITDDQNQLFFDEEKIKEKNAGTKKNSGDDEILVSVDEKGNRENIGKKSDENQLITDSGNKNINNESSISINDEDKEQSEHDLNKNKEDENQSAIISEENLNSKFKDDINTIPLKTKMEILEFIAKGGALSYVTEKYNLSETTILKILKIYDKKCNSSEAELSEKKNDTNDINVLFKKKDDINHTNFLFKMETALTDWIKEMANRKIFISKQTVKSRAKKIFDLIKQNSNKQEFLNLNFVPDNIWFKGFQKRFGSKEFINEVLFSLEPGMEFSSEVVEIDLVKKMEELLIAWILDMKSKNLLINRPAIKNKAKSLIFNLQVNSKNPKYSKLKFIASEAWFNDFLERFNMTEYNSDEKPISTKNIQISKKVDAIEKMEVLLASWITERNNNNLPLSLNIIQDTAKILYNNLKTRSNKSKKSQDMFDLSGLYGLIWFEGFKKRFSFENLKILDDVSNDNLNVENEQLILPLQDENLTDTVSISSNSSKEYTNEEIINVEEDEEENTVQEMNDANQTTENFEEKNKDYLKIRKKRKSISLKKKLRILELLDKGLSKTLVCKKTGLSITTIHHIHKNANKILECIQAGTIHSAENTMVIRSILVKKVEKLLLPWLIEERKKTKVISFPIIRQKALNIFKDLKKKSINSKKERFTASYGWYTKFKKRCGINEIFSCIELNAEPFSNEELISLYKENEIINYETNDSQNLIKTIEVDENVDEILEIKEEKENEPEFEDVSKLLVVNLALEEETDINLVHEMNSNNSEIIQNELEKNSDKNEENFLQHTTNELEIKSNEMRETFLHHLNIDNQNSYKVFIPLKLKTKIFELLDKGCTVSDISTKLKINESIIIKIKDNLHKFRNNNIENQPDLIEKVEKLLLVWISDIKSKNLLLNEHMIQGKAKSLFNYLKEKSKNIEDSKKVFTGDYNWLEGFKKCYNVIIDIEQTKEKNVEEFLKESDCAIVEEDGDEMNFKWTNLNSPSNSTSTSNSSSPTMKLNNGDKRPRNAITLKQKLDIIQLLDKGNKAAHIARQLGLPETTVRTIYKNADKIRISIAAGSILSSEATTKIRSSLMQRMEKLLTAWIFDMNSKNLPISSRIIQEKARSLFNDLKENSKLPEDIQQTFNASHGWLERFKRRSGLHSLKLLNEVANIDVEENSWTGALNIKDEPLSNEDLITLFGEDVTTITNTINSSGIESKIERNQNQILNLEIDDDVDEFDDNDEDTISQKSVIIEENPEPNFPFEKLTEAMKQLDIAMELFQVHDKDQNRSKSVRLSILESVECYRNLLHEKEKHNKNFYYKNIPFNKESPIYIDGETSQNDIEICNLPTE